MAKTEIIQGAGTYQFRHEARFEDVIDGLLGKISIDQIGSRFGDILMDY